MCNQSCSVSVVIPCYKSHLVIRRAVDSVIKQTSIPQEIILIDDASDDGGFTINCIQQLRKDYVNSGIKINSISLANNLGPGGARNCGWDVATSEYVAFLDSDDIWHPKKLEYQFGVMKNNPEIDMSAHLGDLIGVKCEEVDQSLEGITYTSISMTQMFFSNVIQTRSVMLKRNIELSFFDDRYSEDYSLWLRLLEAGYNLVLINKTLAYTFSPPYSQNGLSGALIKMEFGELKALCGLFKGFKLIIVLVPLAIIWSMIKFIRRCILTFLRKLKANCNA